MLSEIIYRIKRNPVLIGAALVAAQSLVDGEPLRAVASVFLGVLVRQFTSPAFEVEERVEDAHIAGYVHGLGHADLAADPFASPDEPGDFE